MKPSVIPGPFRRAKPLVAIGVLTRNRPQMLARLLAQIADARRTSVCDSVLSVWNNGDAPVAGQTHGAGHNVGQHISMNRLMQEASDFNADWFLRIDEDCVFESRGWLAKLVRLALAHRKRYDRDAVFSPMVHGLRYPPETLADVRFGKYHCQLVPILGGICRLMPMRHLRYWRFDERMGMGWSEASTYARFCILTKMPMLRCVNVEVNHGGSTEAQEAADPAWAYESEMLKSVPYGL